jgi:1,4-alpha-glucan branching enzyme
MDIIGSPQIDYNKKTIGFFFHCNKAHSVRLAGSFNNWLPNRLELKEEKEGLWHVDIPILPHGRYLYKYVVDDNTWMEDYDNPLHEPDGINGFYSVLEVD